MRQQEHIISDHKINMHRVAKQRNSFNNFHTFQNHLIGGMEAPDEWARQQREWYGYREQRQREWDAWEAEQDAERMRRKGKETYRRERDERRRGYWEMTEPLTTDEEDELRRHKDFDQWEEFINNGRTEWRLEDPNVQPRYDELSRKDQDTKGSVNYAETRLPPGDYYNRRFNINKHGIGIVGVQYERQPDTGFHYARIHFPRNFQHLTNEEGQRRKAATPAGYHVTLGYNTDYTENPRARAAIDNLARKYGRYQEIMIPNVNVPNRDTLRNIR